MRLAERFDHPQYSTTLRKGRSRDDLCNRMVAYDAPPEKGLLAQWAVRGLCLPGPLVDAVVTEGVRTWQRVRVIERLQADGALQPGQDTLRTGSLRIRRQRVRAVTTSHVRGLVPWFLAA